MYDNLSVNLNLIPCKNDIVKHYIRKEILKLKVLRFRIESGVSVLSELDFGMKKDPSFFNLKR